MTKKPYLEKIQEIDGFTVWRVDGKYIRSKINAEFTNFGQHFRFPFIPLHEFWIDYEKTPTEDSYFIDHMLIEWFLMEKGLPYEKAIGKADEKEIKERKKSEFMQKLKEIADKPIELKKELYVKELKGYDPVKVRIVNGEVVRNLYFIDFTEGGHHFVYKFVPTNEVWLDDDLAASEMDFILLHELHERFLMSQGWIYDSAHRSSTLIEYKARKNPKLLTGLIKEEVEKNKRIVF
jgi:hypothetical protein